MEALVGADRRVALVAADLVAHFEQRLAALEGKAMVVCMSRRICVALYNAIGALRPDWHSDDDAQGAIKSELRAPRNPALILSYPCWLKGQTLMQTEQP